MELRKLLEEQLRLARLSESDDEFTREDAEHLARISLQVGTWIKEHDILPSDEPPHPQQPIVFDVRGTARFKKNRIVRFMLDYMTAMGFTLNDLKDIPDILFRQEDWEQFHQLIGYSVSGYGDVYPGAQSVADADREVERLQTTRPPA